MGGKANLQLPQVQRVTPKTYRKILVATSGGWADVAFLSFLGPAIKEKYPNARVDLWQSRELEDFSPCVQFDNVITFNSKRAKSESLFLRNFSQFLSWVTVNSKNYDLILGLSPDATTQNLAKFGFWRRSVGLVSDSRKKIYSENVPIIQGESFLKSILKILNHIEVEPKKLDFKLRVRQPVYDLTRERLEIFGLKPKEFIVISPGGGVITDRAFTNMRWPFFKNFLELVEKRTPFPILILGEEADTNLVLNLTDVNPKRIHSWAGQASREEMLAAIGEARAYVGCDSGLSFVAAGAGVPGVILYGPRKSKLHQPAGSMKNLICIDAQVPCSPCFTLQGEFDWNCKDNVCMKSISPEQVWESFNSILDQTR